MEAPALPDWVRRSKLAVLALVLAIMPLGSWGACVTGVLDEDDGASIVIWLVSCGLALVGVVAGIVSYRRLEKRNHRPFDFHEVLMLAKNASLFHEKMDLGSGINYFENFTRDGLSAKNAGLFRENDCPPLRLGRN